MTTRTWMRRAAAIGAGLLGATAAGVRTWYGGFDWDGEPDERLHAETMDGWRLGVMRYWPRGETRRCPVVLSHGFAGTSLIFDLGPELSLARYLADNGFDVYAVDLRGRRDSWPAAGRESTLQWSFDDFVKNDLPAVVSLALETSSAEQVLWGGMEMSGQLLYAAAISGTATGIRAGATFGSPAVTPASAKVPGVTTPPTNRKDGRVPFRGGARAAGPILAYTRSRQLASSFRMSHGDPLAVARYFRNGVPDEAVDLVDQFADWVESGTMRSRDHQTVWSDRLGEVDLPVLMVAAERDLQRPADSVAATAAAIGDNARLVRAGKEHGFRVNFGHDDLLVSEPARDEIFPLVRDWFIEHDA